MPSYMGQDQGNLVESFEATPKVGAYWITEIKVFIDSSIIRSNSN